MGDNPHFPSQRGTSATCPQPSFLSLSTPSGQSWAEAREQIDAGTDTHAAAARQLGIARRCRVSSPDRADLVECAVRQAVTLHPRCRITRSPTGT